MAVKYFAYGSNLDERQMRARCPSARRVTCATLRGYALVFGGFSSRWEGAVASVARARGRTVEGVLYEIDEDDLATLDRCEGHPHVYERVVRFVVDAEGRRRRSFVYIQPDERFFPWQPAAEYLQVIRRAYRRFRFNRRSLTRAAAGVAS